MGGGQVRDLANNGVERSFVISFVSLFMHASTFRNGTDRLKDSSSQSRAGASLGIKCVNLSHPRTLVTISM